MADQGSDVVAELLSLLDLVAQALQMLLQRISRFASEVPDDEPQVNCLRSYAQGGGGLLLEVVPLLANALAVLLLLDLSSQHGLEGLRIVAAQGRPDLPESLEIGLQQLSFPPKLSL